MYNQICKSIFSVEEDTKVQLIYINYNNGKQIFSLTFIRLHCDSKMDFSFWCTYKQNH